MNDFLNELGVPNEIRIVGANGEFNYAELLIYQDDENCWHAGYRPWSMSAPLHDSLNLIDSGVRSSMLDEVISSLRTKLIEAGVIPSDQREPQTPQEI